MQALFNGGFDYVIVDWCVHFRKWDERI
jgi:hypothetical protein